MTLQVWPVYQWLSGTICAGNEIRTVRFNAHIANSRTFGHPYPPLPIPRFSETCQAIQVHKFSKFQLLGRSLLQPQVAMFAQVTKAYTSTNFYEFTCVCVWVHVWVSVCGCACIHAYRHANMIKHACAPTCLPTYLTYMHVCGAHVFAC